MTKEQKQYKLLIKADLRIVERNWSSDDKSDRLMAAYHMQQAIEKTIKLKAYIHGINDIWGHDIRALINWCKNKGYDIDVPKLISKNANVYSKWEADCRYYPIKVVRKDSIRAAYNVLKKWLEEDEINCETLVPSAFQRCSSDIAVANKQNAVHMSSS